jgi:hypothetical protein
MRIRIVLPIVFLFAFCSFYASKGAAPGKNLPVSLKSIFAGHKKPTTKKKTVNKKQEDTMKRRKKPAELNKSKRADREPEYHPRTIIVV